MFIPLMLLRVKQEKPPHSSCSGFAIYQPAHSTNRILSGIIGYEIEYKKTKPMNEPDIILTQDLVKLVAEIDEFKGRWEALKNLSPDRLNALRKVATVESVGSSTRIEGAKLSDAQVDGALLHNSA
jgi:hypothetical protein